MNRPRSVSWRLVLGLAALASSASLFSIATAGCSSDDAEGSSSPIAADDGGPSSTVDANAGGDADADTRTVHERFCDAYEAAIVGFYVRCQLVDAANVESLRKQLGAECDYYTSLVAAGEVDLDPASAKCLADLATADCSASVPGRPSSGAKVCELLATKPKPKALGEECSQASGCTANLVCELHAQAPTCGVCRKLGEPGGQCPCNPDTAACASVDGNVTCVAPKADGQPCTVPFASPEPCFEKSYCKGDTQTGICAPRVADGASCSECFPGGACCTFPARCIGDAAETAFCARYSEIGEACDAKHPCASSSFCSAGTCKAKLADGVACTAPAECTSAKCEDGKCGDPKAAIDAQCRVVSFDRLSPACVAGAFCQLPSPFTGAARNGVCKATLPGGATCKAEGQSHDGCTAGACRSGVCTTTPGADDEACFTDAECQPTLYCSQAKVCKPKKALSQACLPAYGCDLSGNGCFPVAECVDGAICHRNVCADPPAAGEACTVNGAPCPTGLVCGLVGGTTVCASVAGMGEACGTNAIACAPRARCVNGTCAPGLPAGSPTTNALECASLVTYPGDGGLVCAPDCAH